MRFSGQEIQDLARREKQFKVIEIKAIAQKMEHGATVSFITALTINDLLELLDIPDPNKPFEDNRRVNKKHAMEFGNYWESQRNGWISPPLLLDTELEIEATLVPSLQEYSTVHISIPASKKREVSILDGQHRVLGWFLKRNDLLSRQIEANSTYNRAVFSGDSILKLAAEDDLRKIEYSLGRMHLEKVGVTLISGLHRKQHQQFFVDIAKNALGINKTVQGKFDATSIVNRVSMELVSSHPLLSTRIDMEKTKCNGSNPNFLSLVNITDIVRHIGFGLNSRVTAKREDLYVDNDLFRVANRFFDLMLKNIDLLSELRNNQISAIWIRENSLLGSGTIWRCLAGAFHETCVIDDESTLSIDSSMYKSYEKFIQFFALDSKLPISSKWFATDLFPSKKSSAPTSRSQDLLDLVNLFQLWIQNEELFNPRKYVAKRR
jgi:hypothetical protein